MPQLGSQKPGLCSLSLLLHAGFTRARALPAWATWLPILRDNSASPRRLCRWCVCPTVRICLHPFPSTRPGRRKTFLRIDSHGSAGGCALGLARVCTREVCVRHVSVCRAGGTVAQRVLNARVWTCRARGGARARLYHGPQIRRPRSHFSNSSDLCPNEKLHLPSSPSGSPCWLPQFLPPSCP